MRGEREHRLCIPDELSSVMPLNVLPSITSRVSAPQVKNAAAAKRGYDASISVDMLVDVCLKRNRDAPDRRTSAVMEFFVRLRVDHGGEPRAPRSPLMKRIPHDRSISSFLGQGRRHGLHRAHAREGIASPATHLVARPECSRRHPSDRAHQDAGYERGWLYDKEVAPETVLVDVTGTLLFKLTDFMCLAIVDQQNPGRARR